MEPQTQAARDRLNSELPQAILGALEHRGFYDAGKYLDDTFLKFISPLIDTYTDTLIKTMQSVIAKEEIDENDTDFKEYVRGRNQGLLIAKDILSSHLTPITNDQTDGV